MSEQASPHMRATKPVLRLRHRVPCPWRPARAGLLAATLLVGLLAISLGYSFQYRFECRATFPAVLCQSLSLAVPRALCAMALLGLVLCLRRDIARHLASGLRRDFAPGCYGLLILGVLCILAPLGYAMVGGALLPPPLMLGFWGGGLALAASGMVLCTMQPRRLRGDALRQSLWPVLVAILTGALLPDVVLQLQRAWDIEGLANATFWSVEQVLHLFAQDVQTQPARKIIAIEDFAVAVGPPCSGIEGLALITVFTMAYLLLFRRDLMLARALWLLPLGLVLSWGLNVIRIAGLILIGRYVSPDLAANGFHSHAGWIAFLTLALGIAGAAHRISWFHVPSGSAVPWPRTGFFADPKVVLILPFAVFMASSTLLSAVAVIPGLYYPLRILAVVAVFWLGRAVFCRHDWQFAWLPLGAGIGCGLVWLATAPPATAADTALVVTLGAMPTALLIGWIVMRVLGTAVVVPLLEECFFRGYLQARIAHLGTGCHAALWGRICPALGVLISALGFGVLHDRVVAGGLAGLLFGVIYARRERLADAVYAHGAANAVIAAAAMQAGAWHLI